MIKRVSESEQEVSNVFGTLLAKSTTDKMRIYYDSGDTERPYHLYVNSLMDGDPCYGYRTLKGAMLAASRFEKGRYSGEPSTGW